MKNFLAFILTFYLITIGYQVLTQNQNTIDICKKSASFSSKVVSSVKANNSNSSNSSSNSVWTDWYYFGKGIKLPQGSGNVSSSGPFTCPKSNCSVGYILWTPNNQPSSINPDLINITVCKSISSYGNDTECVFDCSLKTSVVYCHQYESYSYYMKDNQEYQEYSQVYDCILANQPKPCQAGYGSSTGFEPGCVPLNFNFDAMNRTANIEPVTSSTDSLASNSQVTFKCSVKCPTGSDCSLLNGTVVWLSNNNLISSSTLKYNAATRDLYGFLDELKWTVYLNQMISCKIIPSYNNVIPSFEIKSVDYFSGIKCEIENQTYSDKIRSSDKLKYLTFKEGNTKPLRLKCTSTIPILCDTPTKTSCDFKIWLNYKDLSKYNRVVQKECIPQSNGARSCDACNKAYKNDPSLSKFNSELIWDLNVNMESKNLNYVSELYEIEILSNKNSTDLRPFFSNITLPSLNIQFENLNRPLYTYAYCSNDPHCYTFDRRWFEFHQDGEYQMYENVEAGTRIHLISKACYERPSWMSPNAYMPYCINKIYLQSLYEVIKLDLENQVFYYSNLKTKKYDVPLIFKNGVLLNSLDLFTINMVFGYSMEVITNYGLTLTVYGYYAWWLNRQQYYMFMINPSKSDFGKLNGIFGNWNDNSNDDCIYLRNTNRITYDLPTYYNSFSSDVSDIPSFSKGEYYPYEEAKIQDDHSYCGCLKYNPLDPSSVPASCNNGLNQEKFNKDDSKSNKRSKRSLEYDSVPEINFDALTESKSFEALKNANLNLNFDIRKKRAAEQSQPVTNSSSCDQMANNNFIQATNDTQILNMTNLIKDCKADYQANPEIPWSVGYTENAKAVTQNNLVNDIVQYQRDASGAPIGVKTDIIRNLCPNNCSNGNGICNDSGKCNCTTGFSGADCSIDLAKAPLIIKTMYSNNLYDFSTTTLSDVILLTERYVVDNANSKIKVTPLFPNSSNLTELAPSASVDVFSVNSNTVFLNLTNMVTSLNKQYFFLKFEASNNNLNYSDPVYLTAFDSRYYTCTSLNCKAVVLSTKSNLISNGNVLKSNFLFSIVFLVVFF